MMNWQRAVDIFSLLGRRLAAEFPRMFGPPQIAFQNSLVAIGGSALLILILAHYVLILRARLLGEAVGGFPALSIGLAAFLYLFGFTIIAFAAAKFFQKQDGFYPWAALRHWLVFLCLVPLALMMVMTGLGIFPILIANGVITNNFLAKLTFITGTIYAGFSQVL